ncbi:rho guanine nucleotide exchange factor 28-like isoform X4 [Anarrhichthys ocellatus]|uniref:rho guanine nucleotide exchange factor 28-like isoform X4 n=1 Tax=Anarrhichthys ocellatus TaxID=433405 RepID=UPI0012ED9ABC|nr:rho guanine nucleotide exchange factor 28-like isoform X4 [Anarrhichthys ocellatus]
MTVRVLVQFPSTIQSSWWLAMLKIQVVLVCVLSPVKPNSDSSLSGLAYRNTQGQAKVFALLEGYDSVPEDAEVYVVLEGSTLVHVTRAQSDVMLCFIVPGHNLAEVVSVQAYLCSEATPVAWVGGASLEYVQDDAQDLAEHLVIHGHCLSSTDHKELSSLFNLGQESSRWAMDRRVALAMANLDIPRSWNVLGSHGGDEHTLRESPLHLAVRWGLCRLAELLLCQPGGLMAVSLPNEEGVTPLQLVQTAGNTELLELLTHPPNPLATPLAGLSQVWADRCRLLRFCHDTGNLTLTVRQNLRWSSEESRHADVLLLRDRLRDEDFLREIKALRRERVETILGKEELVDDPTENALYSDIDGAAVEETDYEEPLMFRLNEEEEEEEEDDDPSQFDSEKSQSIRESQAQSPTLAAAVRLSAMIHGKDRVYANAMLVDQVDDADIKYRSPVDEDEEEVSPEPHLGSPCWDSFSTTPPASGNLSQNRHPSSPRGGERGIRGPAIRKEPSPRTSPPSPFASSPSFPSSPLASAFRLFEGAQRRRTQPCLPVSPALNRRGCSLTEASRVLSPSVECDSGEEDILGHSYPCSSAKKQSILRSSSREDSYDVSPDFNRTHSDSTHTPAKNPQEAEVRLRSYSYSSPKAKPSRPLLNRDEAITDLAEDGAFSGSGRSLLQALSLSKSLSRLNQVKQRALSLTETTRDKRVLGFRKRAQSAEEESGASLQHLTLTEFLKEIEDEEWDKYIIPSKVESEKYKVSRTFSFLKSRMSSTRNKAKVKGKEVKEGKEKTGAANGHQFVPATPSGPALCVACDKPVSGKELLQCSNCFLNVHKNCRECVAACGKKLQERNVLLLKSKSSSLPHNSVKDNSPATVFSSSSSLPTTTREKRETVTPLSKSFSISIDSRRLSDAAGVDSECGVTACTLADEGTPVTATPPSAEPLIATQDAVDAPLMSGLSAELLGLEVESWSLAVSPEFCRQHDRHTIKRQEVIYELMQTELHHIQTLTVMSGVFRRGMLEELQLDCDCVARIFPCLDPLLLFHKNLFGALLERRQAAAQAENPHNYLIHQIGDILLQQFSDEYAEEMKQVYGEFCSHHTEAVNVFKELQQQNKKLQNFVKQQSNNTLVRRREVPEFILLVTQRITKYPVLLERILHYTQEGSREHSDLSSALAQIRAVIAAVDLTVNRYERCQELQEVLARLENKSFAKLKNDKVFRKQDLHSKHRDLQYKGLVYWKTATGRLKDTLALLLTDVLVFLQEKDQRFVFAAVDQKPPVIPLQKLIVREVANEERGMFLISASSVGPEMYEVHTNTRDERNAWMRHIRQAVESCPEEEEEEERSAEAEEARRVAEVRVQKIAKFQETLLGQDQQICNSLEEKLQLYAELTELTLRSPEPVLHRHLLVQPDTDGETPRQASALLTAALREAENMITILQSRDGLVVKSPSSPVRGPECCSYNSHGSSIQESPSEPDYLSTLSMSSASPGSDGELTGPDGVLWSPAVELRRGDAKGTLLKVAESVQSLTQLLYSLQAAVTVQDSCYEVQKLLLQEGERPQLRTLTSLQNSLEQEKQRSVDKRKEEVEKRGSERKKEEVDEVQKLHVKLKQVQHRWDKECLAREKQQCEQESELEQREQQCLLEAEQLRCEREELEAQLLEYQQNLDRLREGQRSVEREKEKIGAQQMLLQRWRHHRQSSLPVTIPLDGYKVSSHSRSGSLDGNCSVYENEAALIASLQQNHLRRPANNNQHQHLRLLSAPPTKNRDSPLHSSSYAANLGLSTSLGLSASLYNSLNTLLSQAHGKQPPDGQKYPNHGNNHGGPRPQNNTTQPFSSRVTAQPHGTNSTDFSPPLDRHSPGPWRSEVTGHRLYEDDYSTSPSLTPLLPPQAYLSLEGQNGEEGGEENIVYL